MYWERVQSVFRPCSAWCIGKELNLCLDLAMLGVSGKSAICFRSCSARCIRKECNLILDPGTLAVLGKSAICV